MFGDFVEEELENVKPTPEETDVEEENLEDTEDSYEESKEQDYEEEINEEDKTPYQILMEDLVEKGVLFADEDKEYDVSEDGIQELLEDTVNARLAAAFQENEELAMLQRLCVPLSCTHPLYQSSPTPCVIAIALTTSYLPPDFWCSQSPSSA